MHPQRTLLFLACLTLGAVPSAGGEPPTHKERPRTDRHDDLLPPGAVARLGEVRFWWKDGLLSSLAFSPDGKTLAVAVASDFPRSLIEEPALRLLIIPSGAERQRLKKLEWLMYAVAFSPDGKSLAGIHPTLEKNAVLSVWDLADGTRRYCLEPGNLNHVLAYSPDGRCLATAEYKTVLLRDAATGRELRRLEGHETHVVALAFSPDGKLLASSGPSRKFGTLRFWDVASGKSLREINCNGEALRFTSDGKLLAAWRQNASVSLYEVASGREVRTIPGAFDTAAFSVDGKILATGGPIIRLWELPAGRELRSFPGCAQMSQLTFSPDGKMLAAVEGRQGGRVHVWDVAHGTELGHAFGHRAAVQSLSCTADGRTLVSTGSDGTMRIWDVAEGKQRRILEEREANFLSVAVSADGKTIATMDADGIVTFRSPAGEERGRFAGRKPQGFFLHWSGPKPVLAFPAAGPHVIAGSKVWQSDLKQAPRMIRADKGEGVPLAVTSDGTLFASMTLPNLGMGGASMEHNVRVRRLESGEEMCRVPFHYDDMFWAFAFSPDGKALAVSRSKLDEGHGMLYEHRLLFWKSDNGNQFLKIDLPYRTQALAFSPDGRFVATASGLYLWPEYDRTIRIWETATGKKVAELPGHGGWVNALLFAPDGRRLFSGSDDGSILVWDIRWPHVRPRRTRGDLTGEQLGRAWNHLASADVAQAFRSLSDLLADPRHAVPFLREHIPKPPPLDPQRIARWIAELDSDDFAVREKARRELEKQDEIAEEALRKALQSRPSLEVRRRVEALLERLHQFPPRAEQLQMSRAMLALEWMDTPEARLLIEELARGTPGARMAREAKAAQQRLSRRSEPRP